MTINMKDLMNKLENINEDRFDKEVEEEKFISISRLAHIIAAEVFEQMKANNMPVHSMFVANTITQIINAYGAEIEDMVVDLVFDEDKD